MESLTGWTTKSIWAPQCVIRILLCSWCVRSAAKRASDAVEGRQRTNLSKHVCYYRVGSAIVRVEEPGMDACGGYTLGSCRIHRAENGHDRRNGDLTVQ